MARCLRLTEEAYAARAANEPRPALRLKPVTVPESAVLDAVLKCLHLHPKVAVARRMNAGMLKDATGRPVRFGFVGQPDIWAMLKGSGQTLWVECKRLGAKPTEEQAAFLELIRRYGGRAIVATGPDDVMRELA